MPRLDLATKISLSIAILVVVAVTAGIRGLVTLSDYRAVVVDMERTSRAALQAERDKAAALEQIAQALEATVKAEVAKVAQSATSIGSTSNSMACVTVLARASTASCAGTIRVIWKADTLTKAVMGLNSQVATFLGRLRQA